MKILTSHETAAMLRISMPTLYRHVKSGLIPCIKVGRRTLFREDQIIRMLEKNSNQMN